MRKRMISLLLTLCMVLSMFAGLTTVSAASSTTNTGTRHTVCTSLSSKAAAYYSGNYTINNLTALSGVSTTSSLAAVSGDLYKQLHNLMASTMTNSVSYSSLTKYWPDTDASGGSSTHVLFYSDVINSSANREHVWPKSRASFYQSGGGSDLHHLRPTNSNVNSTRGNMTMGDVRGVISGYSSYSFSGKTVLYYSTSADLVEVNDNIKGDVARILLYVYVRWEEPNLFTVDPNPKTSSGDTGGNNGLKVIESLDTLLEWCRNDPVDTWEMSRNDCVQSIQGNRNVFIDYPEFAWLLFNRELPMMTTPSGYANAHSSTCAHVWNAGTITTQPTCTKTGVKTYACTLCGATKTESVDMIAHTVVTDPAVAPTCTETGKTAGSHCSVCSKVITAQTTIPANGHSWDAGLVTKPATQSEEGVMLYTCTVCSATKTEPISALSHVHNYQEFVTPPTCTAQGYTTHTCSCGNSYVDTYVSALGHIDANSDGVCDRCGVDVGDVPYANPFVDVDENGFYYRAVLWASKNKVTAGVDDTHFSPSSKCTRGQVVTFLWRALGCKEPTISTSDFVDIKSDAYYYKAVLWAAQTGVTSGVNKTHFAPDTVVTRAQFVTFLWRAMGKVTPLITAKDVDFKDIEKDAFYYNAVLWAVEYCITEGVDKTHFAPNTSCTRAQVVTFLWRGID